MSISRGSLVFGSLVCFGFAVLLGCDDDANGSEADRLGVGAQCTESSQCTTEGSSCLTQFKGGYCGLENCTGDADCPQGSACVTHDDGRNYCFLICAEKVDCNVNRTVENESNCVSSITFVDNTSANKACVPPSGT